jgi:hypothetical protein
MLPGREFLKALGIVRQQPLAKLDNAGDEFSHGNCSVGLIRCRARHDESRRWPG